MQLDKWPEKPCFFDSVRPVGLQQEQETRLSVTPGMFL
jgi:hypothetical protein